MSRNPSTLEARFDLLWRLLHPEMPEPECECQVIKGRRFRFDRCWRDARVLVALQGGVWSKGRHVRGSGYERDAVKLNLAQAAGWCVFYLTTTMLRDDPERWLGLIAEAVAGATQEGR